MNVKHVLYPGEKQVLAEGKYPDQPADIQPWQPTFKEEYAGNATTAAIDVLRKWSRNNKTFLQQQGTDGWVDVWPEVALRTLLDDSLSTWRWPAEKPAGSHVVVEWKFEPDKYCGWTALARRRGTENWHTVMRPAASGSGQLYLSENAHFVEGLDCNEIGEVIVC